MEEIQNSVIRIRHPKIEVAPVQKAEVAVVSEPVVMDTSSKLLIYNQHDADSILAAAIYLGRLESNSPGTTRVSNLSQRIDLTGIDTVIWMGVDPKTYCPEEDQAKKNIRHNYYEVLDPDARRRPGDGSVSRPYLYSNPAEEEVTEFHIPQTLTGLVISQAYPEITRLNGLSYHLAAFYDLSLPSNPEDTQMIFANIHAAYHYLIGGYTEGKVFDPDILGYRTPEEDKVLYDQELKKAKNELTRSHSLAKIIHQGWRKKRTTAKVFVYTTISGFEFILARRLISLTHSYYANVSIGFIGTIVFSNLPDFSEGTVVHYESLRKAA